MRGAKTPRKRGRDGRAADVRFVEVEVTPSGGTGLVIELEGGTRLLMADRAAVALAAELLALVACRKGGRR
jgi:hypothetical protein